MGNYSIGRLIGKGSFGKVYLATHKLTNGSKVYPYFLIFTSLLSPASTGRAEGGEPREEHLGMGRRIGIWND